MNSSFAPLTALAQLFFPRSCCGCGSDLVPDDGFFCLSCFSVLPFTGFESVPGNAVEKLFRGRIDLAAAMALFYFTKGSAVQESLHRFKYQGGKPIGLLFGQWMGERLKQSARFDHCDLVIPLPLHPSRERKRGFNQAAVLGHAVAGSMSLPLATGNLIRGKAAATQTKKGRLDRWQKIQGSFQVRQPRKLEGKSILLIDDVVTTGATLEAAARLLLAVPGTSVSLAALACSVAV